MSSGHGRGRASGIGQALLARAPLIVLEDAEEAALLVARLPPAAAPAAQVSGLGACAPGQALSWSNLIILCMPPKVNSTDM